MLQTSPGRCVNSLQTELAVWRLGEPPAVAVTDGQLRPGPPPLATCPTRMPLQEIKGLDALQWTLSR